MYMEQDIKIIESYKVSKDFLEFEIDEKQPDGRPAWIKIKNDVSEIKFLKVKTPKGRFFYTSFFDLYFLPENASSAEMKAFYNASANTYDSLMSDHNSLGEELLKILLLLNINKNRSILSVCSGTGIEMQEISKFGYCNISFLDISETMIAICKKKYVDYNFSYIIGDFSNPGVLTKKYEIIICCMGIHQFSADKLKTFIKNIHIGLSPNGHFIVCGMNLPYEKLKENFKENMFFSVPLEHSDGHKTNVLYFIGEKNENTL